MLRSGRTKSLLLASVLVLVWSPGVAVAAGPVMHDPAVPGPGGQLPEGWVDTRWGPLGPVDRALIDGVRRADLWEGPAGQMAVAKGRSARVRQIGEIISRQHVNELDPLVRKVAGQLGLSVPSQPSDEQLDWLAEMERASGAEFDQVFVDRLRVAHAKVFSLIATVRANTRNSLVREFAQTANKYVDGHITMLDSTNLVAFHLLPTPAAPQAAAVAERRAHPASVAGGLSPLVIWAILLIALAAGVVTAFRVVRPR